MEQDDFLKFFGGDELAADVCKKKYAMSYETSPEQIIDRVASALASVDENPDEAFQTFKKTINNFRGVVPQGSVLAGAGNSEQLMSISNCFVIKSPTDTIESITEGLYELAQIAKRRGGVGTDLSALRPAGLPVNNAAKFSSGPALWADSFSHMTRSIAQLGRGGALMLTLDVTHPDADRWALMKRDLTKITGANVSLKLTDKFMQAVTDDKEFVQHWQDHKKKIRARDLWNTVIESAWMMAEPGLLMWDNITETLPANCYDEFKSTSTNPCSEISLSPLDSCRLVSVCLPWYVKNPFEKTAEFDFDSFLRDVRIAMHMSDNVVELELRHVEKIIEKADTEKEKALWGRIHLAGANGRRTGLGTHGLGDCLIYLGIRYDSPEAVQFLGKLYSQFAYVAYDESIELAIRRGPFPVFDWEKEKHCKFFKHFPKKLVEKMREHGRRNISALTIAPSGTVSLISQCSSGIEPVFRHFYTRRRKINRSEGDDVRVDFTDAIGDKWQNYTVLSHSTRLYAEHAGIATDDIVSGKCKLPSEFVTSDEIDSIKRVELQGTIQTHIDHSISSTINVPNSTTKDEIGEIYINAWKRGLKGVTVYRDGCRSGVLISNDAKPAELIRREAPKRPEILPCDIHQIKAKGENWIALIGLFEGKPYEIFAGKANDVIIPKRYTDGQIEKKKSGQYWLHFNDDMRLLISRCFDDVEGDLTRMISLGLRHGAPLEFVVQQLGKVKGNVTDLSQAIKRVLVKYVKNEIGLENRVCPECKVESLTMQEGCVLCTNCGYSKCS